MAPASSQSEDRPRVLLVDDDDVVRRVFANMLTANFEVVTAKSGCDALEHLQNDAHFDAIVSDINMPGMDGVQLLTAAARRWPDTVRVAMSAGLDPPIFAALINDAHVHRYVSKPYGGDELVVVLQRCLTERWGRRAA